MDPVVAGFDLDTALSSGLFNVARLETSLLWRTLGETAARQAVLTRPACLFATLQLPAALLHRRSFVDLQGPGGRLDRILIHAKSPSDLKAW